MNCYCLESKIATVENVKAVTVQQQLNLLWIVHALLDIVLKYYTSQTIYCFRHCEY